MTNRDSGSSATRPSAALDEKEQLRRRVAACQARALQARANVAIAARAVAMAFEIADRGRDPASYKAVMTAEQAYLDALAVLAEANERWTMIAEQFMADFGEFSGFESGSW